MAWTTEQFTLTCERSGVEHLISIGLPVRHGALEHMPVIVCLDAPWTFGTVLDATRIMSMAGEAPEAVVVGVAFADPSMGDYLRQRARWFTPSCWEPPESSGVKGLTAQECGGAEVLLTFVRDQLLPWIDARYPVEGRWLVGHSFSGLFGLRTLFAAPELFDKWLLGSPSIWWDDRMVMALEQQYALDHEDLDADVFISVGEHEEASGFAMVSNAESLLDTLESRRYRSLKLHREVLPGDGHSNCIGSAISKGLRALMGVAQPADSSPDQRSTP